MNYRILAAASLLALPLPGWQVSDRPSPFPEKQRRATSAKRTADRSIPSPSRPSGQTSSKARASSDSPGLAAGGGVSEDTGKACFFSSPVNGGLTASGERLNSEKLVAAHASYPLGSWVKATNLANDKSVEVRIVDRFPGSSGLVINVSESAARQLDFVRAGTAEVRLELVRQHAGGADQP